jgi:retron-type reverse transcriptase
MISHDWLLENIPMKKSILKQFLKAGFMEGSQLLPTDSGTPQGGVLMTRSYIQDCGSNPPFYPFRTSLL